VVVIVVAILLPDFIQLQITSNGNKTANIYVKNCSVYIQCKGDIMVVDIKQHRSQFEFLNSDLCCFISTTMMSPLHCI